MDGKQLKISSSQIKELSSDRMKDRSVSSNRTISHFLCGLFGHRWLKQTIPCGTAWLCTRCEHSNTSHKQLIWNYLEPGCCKQSPFCKQCGAPVGSGTLLNHQWGAPYYENDAACEQVRKCERCEEITGTCDNQFNRHDWQLVSERMSEIYGDLSYLGSGEGGAYQDVLQKHRCTRCGREDEVVAETKVVM